MEKKKILITVCSLEIGGIERSLIGLLDTFDYTQYDVDVLLFTQKGELLPFVSKECTLLPEIPQCASFLKPIKTVLLEGHVFLAAARVIAKQKVNREYAQRREKNYSDSMVFALLQSFWDCSLPLIPRLKTQYDAALSFMWPHHFVAYKVSAKKKFAWIHTDYSIAALDRKKDSEVWQQFDRIASVSDECGEAFKKVYPELSDKLITVENILPQGFVRAGAREFVPQDMPQENGVYRLLTVGRFSYPKAFDRAVRVSKILKERGVPFRWYFIGYGTQEAQIPEWIRQADVADRCIVLGKKTNPYPYMAACDLYVQPSRYEGKAVTVREAQMLARPVLITDFQTAKSQVHEGLDAVIAPQEEQALADAIEKLLDDAEKRAAFSAYAATHDYSNADQIQTVYTMIEGHVKE